MKRIQLLIPDELEKPMGGMGIQAINLIKNFPDKNYFFDVIGVGGKKFSQDNFSYHPIDGINLYTIPSEPIGQTFLQQSLFVNKSTELEKPHLIHYFDWSSSFAGRILAKRYCIPSIITIQLGISKQFSHYENIAEYQRYNYNLSCALEFGAMMDCDCIIQISPSYIKKYQSFFKVKTALIGNGINNDEWIQKDHIILPGKNKLKIVYIGRFADMKNIEAILNAKLPNEIDLIFIGSIKGGSKELHQAVLDKIQTVSNMYYVGAKYGQEKIDYLFSADAIIMPSKHEPFGIVALEALASKNILLSSFVDGLGDLLTEDIAINCGITSQTIERAYEQLLKLTKEEKDKRIEAGLELCKKYDWRVQSNKLYTLYEYFLKGVS